MPPSLSSWKAGESYGAVPEQEIEFDTDTSRCTTPRQFPTDPSHNMYLQYHEKRSRITLRALGANATYASLFLMFEIMCFTSRNLSPLWDLEKWRKEAMLYCSFTSVVFHLICIFTSVMTNWILSSLESLPPAGERVALKRFHTSFLGRKITNISSISFMAGVPFGLFSCGLVVPLHFKMEHLHNFALAGLSLCSGLMVVAAALTFAYVQRAQSMYSKYYDKDVEVPFDADGFDKCPSSPSSYPPRPPHTTSMTYHPRISIDSGGLGTLEDP